MTLLMINGEIKMVPPIKSTSLGEGNQLFAITLWLCVIEIISLMIYYRYGLCLHQPRFEQYQSDTRQNHQIQIAMETQK
jgi:hypothetical protein